MKWELGALKILARNDTVPGVALCDTIGEIERLNKRIAELIAAGNYLAYLLEQCSSIKRRDSNLKAITEWRAITGALLQPPEVSE